MPKQDKQIICPDIYSGQRVLVVGLGKTGMACVRFLLARGVEIAVMDSRVNPPALQELKQAYPDVPVFLGEFVRQPVDSSDALVVSPGVSLKEDAIQYAKQTGKQIVGDIEIFAKCVTCPVIAITGSNGKSTVTTLVGEMARMAGRKVGVGGNIGLPVLEMLDSQADMEMFVLELSSFQLETTHSLDAAASVILNVSEDHMDRYASMDEYANAKLNIYSGEGAIVINSDDARLMSLTSALTDDRKVFYFTLGEPNADNVFGITRYKQEDWLARGKQRLLPVAAVRIQGQHNIANILASLALGAALDLPIPAMLEAIQLFRGLPHRTQWVAEHNGVSWFNDSKATNVGAAIAAIEGLQAEKLIVLMGGQGKGQDFTPLKKVLARRARHVLLFGQDAQQIAQVLATVPHSIVANLSEAVLKAKQLAYSGDAVLLSPACASFDMFKGFEHRGDTFMQMVREVTQ
jgi:UDP-N-acetylmuramoylalanine--D-glutamate ligase